MSCEENDFRIYYSFELIIGNDTDKMNVYLRNPVI